MTQTVFLVSYTILFSENNIVNAEMIIKFRILVPYCLKKKIRNVVQRALFEVNLPRKSEIG